MGRWIAGKMRHSFPGAADHAGKNFLPRSSLPVRQPARRLRPLRPLVRHRPTGAAAGRGHALAQAAMRLLQPVRQGPVALRRALHPASRAHGRRPCAARQTLRVRAHLLDDRPRGNPRTGAQARPQADARRLGQRQPGGHAEGSRRADRRGQGQPGRGHGGDRRQRDAAAQGSHRRAPGAVDRPGEGPGQPAGDLRRCLGILAAAPGSCAGGGLPHHPPAAVLGRRPGRHRRCPRPRRADSRGVRQKVRAQGHPYR